MLLRSFPVRGFLPRRAAFFPDGEIAKATDQNVVATNQGALDGFQDRFNDVRGFEFVNAEAVSDGSRNVVFGESHGRKPPETRFIWKQPIPCSTIGTATGQGCFCQEI